MLKRSIIFWKIVNTIIFGGLLLVSFVGCQKKCQLPPDEPFTSLTEVKWRLAETTDPEVKNFDNFNFFVMTFNPNFTGEVHKVEFNDMYQTPVSTFRWNLKESGVLEIIYSSITPQATSIRGVIQNTVTFSYRLGYTLEMTNLAYGYYYRYVDYRGIVTPDNACTF